jgi:hypothetical protein
VAHAQCIEAQLSPVPHFSNTRRSSNTRRFSTRLGASALAVLAMLGLTRAASARPNTHGPAISTWDARASSVVLGLGRAVSGDGGFTLASYNANFSSTSGILSAQFGVHYVTYEDTDSSPTARGVSAGGVALISVPMSERFENGVARSSFAFYLGGVPTALFSGQLNFISVPLVLGLGFPFSPADSLTFSPWVELSPGLNFDTRIQQVSTDSAIQSALDGTLTRQEVEDLVEQGLVITRETTVGTRAGLSLEVHMGERVDFDLGLLIGAGHPGAVALGGALVFRWDAMVPGVLSDRDRLEREDCASIEARFRSCPASRRSRATAAEPIPATRQRPPSTRPNEPRRALRRARPAAAEPMPQKQPPQKRKPPPPPRPAPAPIQQKPKNNEFPPLQAAPPKPPA